MWICAGDRKYGHLAFTNSDKNKLPSSDQMTFDELDCTRLRSYLSDELHLIGPCVDSSRQWTYRYNGSHPPIKEAMRMLSNSYELEEAICGSTSIISSQMPNHAETKIDQRTADNHYPLVDPADIYSYCMEQLTSCLSEMKSSSASPGQSSGYYSINGNLQPRDLLKEEASFFSKEVQDDLEFWSLMRDEDFECTTVIPPVCI